MVDRAAIRAKEIAKEIAESIKRDEDAHIQAIKTRREEIDQGMDWSV